MNSLAYTASQKIVLPIAFGIMLGLAILMGFLFKGKDEKTKSIPFFIIGLILLALEIGKQIYYIFIVPYELYALPFHFCTLTIFLIILSNITNTRFSKFLRPIAFAFAALVVPVLYIAPTATIGHSTDNIFLNYYQFHTFTFHHVVVFYVLLSITMQTYKPKPIDCLKAIGGVIFYGSYATPIAFSLNCNYVSIISCPIPLLEQFRQTAGQFWYDAVWFILACTVISAIIIVYWLILKGIEKILA